MESGSLNRKKRTCIQSALATENFQNRLREYFIENPRSSLLAAANFFNKSSRTVYRALKRMKFKAYKCRFQQKLYGDDKKKRLQFARTMRRLLNNDHNLKFKILWTDECLIKLADKFNRQNNRYIVN